MTPNVSSAALPPMVEDAVTGSSARRIFMRRYDNDDADYVLVLVHGTAGNSESYDAFAEHADAEVAPCRGEGQHDGDDEQTDETRIQGRRVGVGESAIDHEAHGHRQRQCRHG